jgi:hypothetical protein
MRDLLKHPLAVGLISFFVFWFSEQIGARLLRRGRKLDAEDKEGFNVILGATLTLLGLLVGFAFAMAVGRYDQRKNYEEEEANAIGTEYLRLDLLPAADAEKLRPMLQDYLQLRISFYETRTGPRLREINHDSGKLQNGMWQAVQAAAKAQPSPITALAVAGMNDVLNRQGYTQAAYWNRIPTAAWALLATIAIFSSVMVGYEIGNMTGRIPLAVLPVVLSIALFLLADLDSPRGGVIRVHPQNLTSLSDSLTPVK